MTEHPWAGRSLGERTVGYTDRDPILYALALGADPQRLDLVFEDQLRVLPTFALTLAQWAVDSLGVSGAVDPANSLHVGQKLEVRKALPVSGEVTMAARVGSVFDKGAAAVFEVEVESDYFFAVWTLFAPGFGGFGGDRGPRAVSPREGANDIVVPVRTFAAQPALYRLLGDRHALHIDPKAAEIAGMPGPLMHGMCTLAASTLPLAAALGGHPADLTSLHGRFTAPAFPGDELSLRAWSGDYGADFVVEHNGLTLISGAGLTFA
ncbi:MaoC/PaaZ C-terminal domain-containing protein [Rhodococcus globerulus]|uniref:MaoC/PaaZ C-terminal domain-containing protein n=1 Tax=Rhodococcus globerulus TaxID=33008 RepID=UPI0030161682